MVSMDTIVTASVVSDRPASEVQAALQRALGWFGEVERVCTRFDPSSELMRLRASTGRPIEVSPLLFEAVRFSLEVAAISGGAFDPTVGAAQARRGFDRNYVTGEHIAAPTQIAHATYRDIVLTPIHRTIELRRPLVIDLGAVAKGMAIDLAGKELAAEFESFSIDAGGDVVVQGRNPEGEPWRIGIEHPRQPGLLATLLLEQGSVCTSGDYERPAKAGEGEHHLLDPHSGRSPRDIVSCTVVAPTAMAADALSTAAFVSGPEAGLRLLEQQGVGGLIVDRELRRHMTAGFERWLA
ncbi:MAG: FAD:protein FMN transferase [Chloroflexi bacterium]|nr:FAD:protein FMN transferase [Chloroflexota bacterium]